MEEAHQGRDKATLEVVMKVARPLTHSQLEGLGLPTAQAIMPPSAVGPSQLPAAEAVQPPVVVASQLPQPMLPPSAA